MSKEIKILTPRIYEHSDFFHNAVDFAREHSLNTNELCLELSHYLVDNFDKVWKIEKPRVYKRVAELEAKLAESEENCFDLQQRLTDKEEQCRECKHLNKKIELNIKNKLLIENEQLKQQLAEKDAEIEQLKKFDDLNKTFFDLFRTAFKEPNKVDDLFNTLKTMQEKQDQDKISFAVEQLEKVKEFVKENESWEIEGSDYSIVYADDVLDQIDNQIKELKKEMK